VSGVPVTYARAPKRPLELAADDGRRLCQPDHARPFSSVYDAVNRLLPFHVRACFPPLVAPSTLPARMQSLSTLGSLRVARRPFCYTAAVQSSRQALGRREVGRALHLKCRRWGCSKGRSDAD